ncbi:MAG TPA: RidA family protein [Rhizomicrobium sp.]|jgi:enamine deaminase RidA (YjgF/YER057c/UK114 family)|nr:RidA family protein [Rhizomicrobium sp.]
MKFVNPPDWPRPSGYSNGVIENGFLFVSGQVGWDGTGAFPPDLVAQIRQALRNICAVIEGAGAAPDRIVRLTWYVTDRQAYKAHLAEIGAAYRETIGRHFPAMSVVEVSGLVEAEAQVEIEATVAM